MDICSRVAALGLPLGQYAVFGSSLLDLWGIRPAKDLDIIVLPDLFESLRSAGWEVNPAHGFERLTRGDADVTTLQAEPTDGLWNPDRRELIRTAAVVRGVPFVRVEHVVACKLAYAREKDHADIASIATYLAGRAGDAIYELG